MYVPPVHPVVEVDVLELEDHVHLAAGRVSEKNGLVDGYPRHLSHGQRHLRALGEYLLMHLLQELVDTRVPQT